MKRILFSIIVACVLINCSESKTPSTEVLSDPQRVSCKKAIMTFIKVHSMMSDESGNIIQLNQEQTVAMKNLIKSGITDASIVTDSFLSKVSPEMPNQFRSNLVKGWELYLNGLEQSNPSLQIEGIQLVQQWEEFKDRNIDYIYSAIIQ